MLKAPFIPVVDGKRPLGGMICGVEVSMRVFCFLLMVVAVVESRRVVPFVNVALPWLPTCLLFAFACLTVKNPWVE